MLTSVPKSRGVKRYVILAALASLLILGSRCMSQLQPTNARFTMHSPSVVKQGDKAAADHGRKIPLTVVITALKKDNLTLLAKESGLRLGDGQIVYVADDPHATYRVPINKGNEAMIYLAFLIDQYHLLPDVIVFTHPHLTTYHNNHLFHLMTPRMMERLRPSHILERGFVSLRCHWSSYCTEMATPTPEEGMYPISLLTRHPPPDPTSEYSTFATVWETLFPGQVVPTMLGTVPGGQFALSCRTAHRVPLAELKRLRQWILDVDYLSSKDVGAVFEMLWHDLFLGVGGSALCPVPYQCYCGLYGVCLQSISSNPGPLWEELEALGQLRYKIKNCIEALQVIGARESSELRDSMLSEYSDGWIRAGLEGFSEYVEMAERNITSIESYIDGIVELGTSPQQQA